MQEKFEQLDLFGFPVEPPKQPKKKAVHVTLPSPAVEEPVQQKAEKTEEAATAKPAEIPYKLAAPAQPVIYEEEEAPAEPEPVSEPQPVMMKEETVAVVSRPNVVRAPKNPSIVKTTGKRGRKSFREMDSEVDLIEVPEEEVLKQKLYYSISEVAGWFKVNTSLLRFWENEFDILQPRKTRKGDRLFRVEDVKNLQLIYFLLRQRKFSIDGAKNYLKNHKKEADTQAQLVQSLTKFKSFLLELKANLAG